MGIFFVRELEYLSALKMTQYVLAVIKPLPKQFSQYAPCAGVRINVDNFHLFMSYKTFTFVSLLTNKTSQNEKCKQFSMGFNLLSCFS